MDTTIEHQLNIKSKESTLQLAYDVLRICPFFKAFLIITDVPEIYMQEFWATTTVHYHSIRFKMNNNKHIIDLELFRDILHICPIVQGQSFTKTPFEEEILAFIRFLRHSAAIRMLTDVNINKLYQPWRSYAALINKDDFMFSTIKLVSRHQNTQQFGALLPIELTNDEIRNFKAYKEYYAIATGEAAPKPKASVRRTRSSSDTSITPPTAVVAMTEAQQLKLVTKRSMQQTHISQPSGSGADEGTGSKPGVPDVPTDESEEELTWDSTDDEGDDNEEKNDDGDEEDKGDDGEEGNDEDDDGEESDDDDDADQEVVRNDDKDNDEEDSEDEGDGEEDLGLNIGEEERHNKKEEKEEDKLYRDININQGRGLQASLEVEDSHVTLTLVHPDGQQESSSVSSQFVTSMLNSTLDVGMESFFKRTSRMDVQTPTSVAHVVPEIWIYYLE
nr:hypothetical protein [Tanacetum cinerariifolium]